ncbi:M24 family metallopeptidase [Thermosediminibacter litoriperuensis]|uniref:Xaa-Pro aminopeptidase n=1 Tax=Thermosediminibacter litoriperuensis TaxID=291989 RepID=A0A5S5AQ35_9FIRM|nr:M24 family metallopeptidase [Thermosediminibacter litoriperuensis]TYP53244.1 Xaa-Pro aminopeptidase [Thermosediminibacter litoriperuensis]
MVWSKQEFDTKVARIRNFMAKEDIDGILITTQVTFKWLTGARPYVNVSSEKSCADLLVTKSGVYLVANNIEAKRLVEEELNGIFLEKIKYPWWEPFQLQSLLNEIVTSKKVFTDKELGDKFARLRWDLLPEEQERFYDTAKCVADILEKVAYYFKPGDSEQDVASLVKEISVDYDVNPVVNLVAADDRAFKYRHPLPTEKKIEKYALIAISGEKHGLVASATRLVHFGTVPAELKKRHEAVLLIDAAFITSTLPGVKVKEIFIRGQKAYEAAGYPEEWKNHHQGGMAGYNSREFRATPYCEETVKEGQVFAWNPTIAGVKSEDTILVKRDGPEILTVSDNFPVKEVKYGEFFIKRPDILIR